MLAFAVCMSFPALSTPVLGLSMEQHGISIRQHEQQLASLMSSAYGPVLDSAVDINGLYQTTPVHRPRGLLQVSTKPLLA